MSSSETISASTKPVGVYIEGGTLGDGSTSIHGTVDLYSDIIVGTVNVAAGTIGRINDLAGTVEISNITGGTLGRINDLAGTVEVSNISDSKGTVEIKAGTLGRINDVAGTIEVSAMQGTVNITNFPTTQLVAGTLEILGGTIGRINSIGTIDFEDVYSSFDHASNSVIDSVGTAISSISIAALKGIVVKAANANTQNIYIGNSDVTAGTIQSTEGFELGAGESLLMKIDNANKIYAKSSSGTQKVSYLVI